MLGSVQERQCSSCSDGWGDAISLPTAFNESRNVLFILYSRAC